MISVVLATHNEAVNIERCLDSVKSFSDEIIIADGESTDNTVELAKKYGAKIISTTNKVNFHINKQIAMDAARGELVLQLDADEVIDEELAKFILKVAQNPEGKVAWWIRRKNFFMGQSVDLGGRRIIRSEEHTSELQSHSDIVCRLLLAKKKEPTDD